MYQPPPPWPLPFVLALFISREDLDPHGLDALSSRASWDRHCAQIKILLSTWQFFCQKMLQILRVLAILGRCVLRGTAILAGIQYSVLLLQILPYSQYFEVQYYCCARSMR